MAVLLAGIAVAVATGPAALQGQDLDILIRGGLVVDGTGGPEFLADVGIIGDEIVAVSRNLAGATAVRIIDARDMVVTPAFIDLHSHADRYMILDDPELWTARGHVLQGIATVVGAPDGRTRAFPVREEVGIFRSQGIGMNFVPMVGHQEVRSRVMGDDFRRHATPDEVEAMQALVREGMEQGAWGLGTGLEYEPGVYSHPDEVVELARVVAEYGGFHFSHMRGSGRLPKDRYPSRLLEYPPQVAYTGHGGPSLIPAWSTDAQDALREIIEISRQTGIPSVASHVKAKGRMSWGRALSDIILVNEARDEGLPVYLDQYPYEGHSGGNGVAVPGWGFEDEEGNRDDPRANLRRHLDDPETREKLRMDTEYVIDYKGGPDRLLITGYPDEALVGKTVAEVAELWELTPEETIWEFVFRGFEDPEAGVFIRPFSLHPKDVALYMQQDYTATSSDGRLVSGPGLHPRHYGAFARKIAHYARDEGVVSLPHAVRSSSGLPAQIIGLPDRGLLKEGFKADVLVFDLEEFEDRSTALDPEQYAVGLSYMLVNGEFAIDGGEFQGIMAGRVLERHRVQTTPERVRTDRGGGEDNGRGGGSDPGLPSDPGPTFDPGTEDDRAALFDELVRATLERDAFATLPEHPVHRAHPAGIDVVAEMERWRDELLAADSDSAMYYALLKISNARLDRHLRIVPVEGGLAFPDTFGIQESQANAPVEGSRVPRAPIRLRVDYGGAYGEADRGVAAAAAAISDPEGRFVFVADRSREVAAGAYGAVPEPGDRVTAVNGVPIDEYREAIRPYHRVSTEDSFWWQLATWIPQRSVQFPRRFHGEELRLELEARDGDRYTVALPWLYPEEIEWEGHGEIHYPGFSRVAALDGFETLELFLPDAADLPVVLLRWHGFRGDLMGAMDRLMEHAEAHDLLDRHVIFDATRASGGSRGAYAVQRLQPRPFRTTFGNLKVSDAMEGWVEDQIAGIREGRIQPASVDDGTWLLEWLETDVREAIASRRMYTNDVPFKGAHAPRWSDGIIEPAPVHFRGGLTVWLGPKGGSHLDQFAAQVVDNGLGHVMGMAAGGYSNTWQVEEVLPFPTTGRPIVGYMWSMGHTIRPNGQVLQYNPAQPHELVPQTRENYFDYHARLLQRTLERVQLEGAERP